MRVPDQKQKKETERTVTAMASEMAASKAAFHRSYVLFETLAASIGVDVSNALRATE